MKRIGIKIFAASTVLLALGTALIPHLRYGYGVEESAQFIRVSWQGNGGETHFASRFSDQAFDTVVPGMTRDKVEGLLGRGLFATTKDPVVVYYSAPVRENLNRSPQAGWVHERWLEFRNGRVVGKRKAFRRYTALCSRSIRPVKRQPGKIYVVSPSAYREPP